jgi:peptidoglycan/xylan/chitin deacetylase (PgdA/CDA1 family)
MPMNATATDPSTSWASPATAGRQMSAFLRYAKCPPEFAERLRSQPSNGTEGFFEFSGLQLYGRVASGLVSPTAPSASPAIDSQVQVDGTLIHLPFDPDEIIDNLRLEKYVRALNSENAYVADNQSLYRRAYYALRPLFPVRFRRILQRIALNDWASIPFPKWPLDTTVDDLIARLWKRVLGSSEVASIPFIWYWPKRHHSCAIMTHDVETGAGQKFCHRMLEMEAEFGIKSSFELVPEVRYQISEDVLKAIRSAGSEICIHGLNHDGRLFSSEATFRSRAGRISAYARDLGATGFRSPVMYRNPAWYDAFEFSYDMSMPNAAQLDPQRGGCCTLFPYFIGNILELPLTTIQDYPLYHVLRSDPMAMWTSQLEAITARHGMASFIIHPDYTIPKDKQTLYRALLGMLSQYGMEKGTWLALPGEVDRWWRQRDRMTLVREGTGWAIRGEGCERAAVAYARLENGRLRLTVES